jgi:heme exporter protein C
MTETTAVPSKLTSLANPTRFVALVGRLLPWLAGLTALCLAVGIYLSFSTEGDYQQGETVRIMFIHVPAAMMSLFVYACLGVASLLALVYRHLLADCAAQAAAVLGTGFTVLALITGSLWGRPMWGTWWVWDPRLTSVLVLLLFYIAYLALRASIDDETKAGRAAAILALVGLVNLPIVHFSVTWWNSLHQGSSMFTPGALAPVYAAPLWLMLVAYLAGFGSLWLVRIRG